MNLPNKLTVIRVLLVIPFIMFLLYDMAIYAAATFVVAAITDFFDGHIARKKGIITDFGKLMDPLADKVLVIAAFVIFVQFNYIPAWMLIVILAREFLVAGGLRSIAASKGDVIPAGLSGKIKTVSQMIAVIVIIFTGASPWSWWTMFVVTLITIWSGIDYSWKGRKYFSGW